MARGRKPDPLQAAKGNPGRRKSKVQKREEEAHRVAELLASAATADPLTPPAIIDQGPLYAGAVAVWKEMAPRLVRTHRLTEEHRLTFAMFCVYFADWVSLNDQLKREGMTQNVKTVAGGMMMRDHPAVRHREICYGNVLELARKFGMTPLDSYDLFKSQQLAGANNPGLFGGQMQQRPAEQEETEVQTGDGIAVGMLGGMNSAPPTQLN